MDSFLKIEELHHIGIAVKDFDEILIFFSLLGYEKTSSTSVRDELQKVDLIFLTHKKNHPSIELVKPYTADSPVNGYLKNNNTAFYHICYEVSSIEETIEEWTKRFRVINVSKPKPAILFNNRLVSFYFINKIGLVELLEQK